MNKENKMTTERLTFPATMGKSKRLMVGHTIFDFFHYGNASLSSEGLQYRTEGFYFRWFFKVNLFFKYFHKTLVDKQIKYQDIIDIKILDGNTLEITTNEVDGQYYLWFYGSNKNASEKLYKLLYACKSQGLDQCISSSDNTFYTDFVSIIKESKKIARILTIILQILGIICFIFSPLISLILFIFTLSSAKQSDRRFLHAISVILSIITLIFAILTMTGS